VDERICGSALIPQHPAEAEVGVGLACLVAEFSEQGDGLLEVDAGLVVLAEPTAGAPDACVSVGLAPPVTVTPCGVQGRVLGGGPVVQVPSPLEVDLERAGKLPGVGAPSGGGGQLDGCEQHRVLGLEPGPRRRAAGLPLRYYSGLGRGQGEGLRAWMQAA